MSVAGILNQNTTKKQKAFQLFSLGYDRRQVAQMLCNGNYGYAHNMWKLWSETQITPMPVSSVFEFVFNRRFGVKVLIGNPQEFEANSNEEIVLKMKDGGFTASQTISEYMLGYAIRAVHWDNSDIRATDTDSFVEDLIKNKHIEVTDR